MSKILVATTSEGKIREVKYSLSDTSWEVITPQDIGLEKLKVEETGTTFAENALIKAKAFAAKSSLITLADDSGLVVKTLDGRPGVYSARYGPTDEKKNQKLLKEMEGIKDRSAYFEASLVIYDPRSKKSTICRGTTEGRILDKPLGNQGFGYDPIFFSLDLKKSFGEATTAEKNSVSHRGRALRQIMAALKNY